MSSDVELPSFTNEVSEGESTLPFAIPFGQIRSTEHDGYGLTGEKTFSALREMSDKRRGDSAFFARLRKNISVYRDRKDETSVTLNEAEYRARLKQFASNEKEAEESLSEPSAGIVRNEFIDEVLGIAADYAKLLRG